MKANEIREETARLKRVGRVLDAIKESGREVEEVSDDEIVEQLARDAANQYEVIVGPDRAEAEDLGGALLAAATLLQEQRHHGGASHREARQNIIVLRDGMYDGVATMLARSGQREALSAEWSR